MKDKFSRIRPVEPICDPRNGPPRSAGSSKANRGNGKTKSTAGRFQVLNQFVDQSARLVSYKSQSVWLVLFRETKPDGLATVSYSQIAEMMGAHRSTALRGLAELKKAGLAEVIKKGNSQENRPSTYRIYGIPIFEPS